MTAKEIQKKFALPYTPKYVSENTFKPGTEMRAGLVNENFEQPGGGLQFDLKGVNLNSEFKEIGEIK